MQQSKILAIMKEHCEKQLMQVQRKIYSTLQRELMKRHELDNEGFVCETEEEEEYIDYFYPSNELLEQFEITICDTLEKSLFLGCSYGDYPGSFYIYFQFHDKTEKCIGCLDPDLSYYALDCEFIYKRLICHWNQRNNDSVDFECLPTMQDFFEGMYYYNHLQRGFLHTQAIYNVAYIDSGNKLTSYFCIPKSKIDVDVLKKDEEARALFA